MQILASPVSLSCEDERCSVRGARWNNPSVVQKLGNLLSAPLPVHLATSASSGATGAQGGLQCRCAIRTPRPGQVEGLAAGLPALLRIRRRGSQSLEDPPSQRAEAEEDHATIREKFLHC
jgi:hypothetical protein